MKHQAITIDLLRHGEVAADTWAFRGSTDIALSDKGWQQMRRVEALLEDVQSVATSPLQRCALFAAELSDKRGTPCHVLNGMREMDFGQWENQPLETLQGNSLLAAFQQSPVGLQPPGGEHFDVFVKRVLQDWQQWLQQDVGEHRLLVAHGGVLRVILCDVLGMPLSHLWRIYLPYAAWSRVSVMQGEQARLLFMNRSVS